MGSNELKSPVYFICGTPTDKNGFECITLDGQRFPDRYGRCLEVIPAREFSDQIGVRHLFHRQGDKEDGWAMYAEYRSIHPNDTDQNRGAYIAAGCWSSKPLFPEQLMSALKTISAVHRSLAEKRDPKTNSFPPKFRLHGYKYPHRAEKVSSDQFDKLEWADIFKQVRLADLFSHATEGRGIFGNRSGYMIVTSDEVEQGELAQFYIHSPKAIRASVAPAPAESRRRQRSFELMPDTVHEAHQIRKLRQRLCKIEAEIAEVRDSLPRASNEATRRSRIGKLARRLKTVNNRPYLTTQGIILLALRMTIGAAVPATILLVILMLR